MKKYFLLLFLFVPMITHAVSASSYAVMDYDSGRVLESSNGDQKRLIASTTKIMTAIVALEKKELNSKVVVGEEVLDAFGSAIYLSMDEEITLQDLLYGLLLRSGNDAAIEIAFSVASNMENFVKLMNDKAYELGMTNTYFINPHGLEDKTGNGNKSTAVDMAILMRYALHNDVFRTMIHTKSYTAKTSLKTYVWKNKNKLLFTDKDMLGGKTGYTIKAHRTLVTASKRDNKTVIVVTLNDGNDFKDHQDLATKIFTHYDRIKLLDKDTFTINNETLAQFQIKESVYALLTKEEQKNISIDYQIDASTKNSQVGVATIYLKKEIIEQVPIYQNINQEKKSESIGILFFRWLFKKW